MQQLVFIHGGEAFHSYEDYFVYLEETSVDPREEDTSAHRWSRHLAEDLGNTFEVFTPRMPSHKNAKYAEWELWFTKHIPYIEEHAVLVGHSLGANFLAKYLAMNELSIMAQGLHLVAGCFGAPGGFDLPDDMSLASRQCRDIIIYHSRDDVIVPFADAESYKQALPEAVLVALDDRGHFLGDAFPELISNLQRDA